MRFGVFGSEVKSPQTPSLGPKKSIWPGVGSGASLKEIVLEIGDSGALLVAEKAKRGGENGSSGAWMLVVVDEGEKGDSGALLVG